MNLKNLFPTHIFTTTLDPVLSKKIEELVTPRLNNLEELSNYKTDYFKESIVNPLEIKDFLFFLNNLIQKFSKTIGIPSSLNINYWVQDYNTKDFHSRHNHGLSSISGIYYVRANQSAGVLRFYNPNPISHILNYNKPTDITLNTYYDIQPIKGLLILFPSWLDHEVLPSLSKDCVRTSLSFNVD